MSENIENYSRILGVGGEDPSCFPSLTLKQKLVGMTACMGMGLFLNVLSFFVLSSDNTGRKMAAYAVLFTTGNLITILGSCFIWGFKAQLASLTHKKRVITSAVYFSSMLLTLIVAFTVNDPARKIIIVVLLTVQYVAYIWYTLSYIPFARTAVKTCFKSTIS